MTKDLSVMDRGAALLEEDASEGVDFNTLQKKEIGLNVLLLGLAERNALRIKKLNEFLEGLEEDLFDIDMIENLTRAEKIEMFNLATNAINSSSNYIRSSINSTNWEDLSTKLQVLAASIDGEGSEDGSSNKGEQKQTRELAARLLQELSGNLSD